MYTYLFREYFLFLVSPVSDDRKKISIELNTNKHDSLSLTTTTMVSSSSFHATPNIVGVVPDNLHKNIYAWYGL